MSIRLPAAIAQYLDAENSGDLSALADCFAPAAVVRDEGGTHSGLAAIEQWMRETRRKYHHAIEPLALESKDHRVIVRNRLTGDFPGSPIELRFAFTLDADRITSLEIGG